MPGGDGTLTRHHALLRERPVSAVMPPVSQWFHPSDTPPPETTRPPPTKPDGSRTGATPTHPATSPHLATHRYALPLDVPFHHSQRHGDALEQVGHVVQRIVGELRQVALEHPSVCLVPDAQRRPPGSRAAHSGRGRSHSSFWPAGARASITSMWSRVGSPFVSACVRQRTRVGGWLALKEEIGCPMSPGVLTASTSSLHFEPPLRASTSSLPRAGPGAGSIQLAPPVFHHSDDDSAHPTPPRGATTHVHKARGALADQPRHHAAL